MKYGSSSFSVFLVDGVSLLAAKLQGVTHKVESITERTDGLGDVSEAHGPVNMMKASLAQNGGFFDDAVGGMHALLKAGAQTERQVVFSVDAVTFTGSVGTLVTAYEVIAKIAGLSKANASYQVTGDVDSNGVILQNAAQTIDWNGASVDNAASSPDGGVAYLHITALAGLTGFVGHIESSVDNAAWLDLVTFANVTAAPAAQRIAVAGVIPRYLRFRGDVTGTGTITVFAGFSRN
jgi:hypothetical protein